MSKSSDAFVPMPDTHHPYYDEAEATAIRSAIVNGLHKVHWIDKRLAQPAYSAMDAGDPISAALPALTLAVKKCAGPAPFVGDPFLNDARYYWKVAVDDMGRHVASEAHLTWRYSA